MSKLLKRIAFDATGILLIVVAVPIGWLPGPGGIPLALIGLGLLAKNNKWARDLLDDFEDKFRYYSNKISHASPRAQLALDVVFLSLLAFSLYLSFTKTGVYQLIGAALITSSLVILLVNRKRGVRLWSKIKRNKT